MSRQQAKYLYTHLLEQKQFPQCGEAERVFLFQGIIFGFFFENPPEICSKSKKEAAYLVYQV